MPEASSWLLSTPQISHTTMAYSVANLAAAAASHAISCLLICFPDLSASIPSSTTKMQLPAIMAGTVRIWGAIPSAKASTGEHRATVMPQLMLPTRADTASTALTQEPVTSWPRGLVSACSDTSNASMTAVSVIQRIFLFIKIPSFLSTHICIIRSRNLKCKRMLFPLETSSC